MTRPTSESIFNITPQALEFCNDLDPILKPFLKILDNLEKLKTLSNIEDNINIDPETKSIRLFDVDTLEKYDYDVDVFKQRSEEMDTWFTGWLNLFNESVEKEQQPFLKHDLQSESMFYQSMIERFRFTSKFFIEESVNSIDRYNQFVENIKQIATSDKIDDKYEYYYSLSDASDAIVEIESLIERMREAASLTRQCANKDLKVRTKTQLFRIKNKTFEKYLTEYNIHERRDFRQWSNYDYKVSISRCYMY